MAKPRCARCGRKAKYEWSICADGNKPRPICAKCDVELNTMVMRWAFGASREADIKAYRKLVLGF
jgi:NAD-dependent SIR2 family protein deacetylase